MTKVLVSLCFVLISACALKITEVNPKPNIELGNNQIEYKLKFGKNISDEFVIPPQNGIRKIGVTKWKTSLSNGFVNGFSEYQPDNAISSRTLKLTKADVMLIPAAVSYDGGIPAARAVIDYKAELLDEDGNTISKMSGTSTANVAATGDAFHADGNGSVADAIKIMYEDIASKMLSNSNDSDGNRDQTELNSIR